MRARLVREFHDDRYSKGGAQCEGVYFRLVFARYIMYIGYQNLCTLYGRRSPEHASEKYLDAVPRNSPKPSTRVKNLQYFN